MFFFRESANKLSFMLKRSRSLTSWVLGGRRVIFKSMPRNDRKISKEKVQTCSIISVWQWLTRLNTMSWRLLRRQVEELERKKNQQIKLLQSKIEVEKYIRIKESVQKLWNLQRNRKLWRTISLNLRWMDFIKILKPATQMFSCFARNKGGKQKGWG